MPKLDQDELKKKAEIMTKAMTSDAYLQQLEKVSEAPEEEKMVAASKYLTPRALREAGVDLPDDARMSSRYFEDPGNIIEVGDAGSGPNVVNVLNERHPGLLDKLKKENPDVFEEIVKPSPFGVNPIDGPGPLALCWCSGSKDGGCHGGGI